MKKTLKNTIAVIAVATALLSMAGCGKEEATVTEKPSVNVEASNEGLGFVSEKTTTAPEATPETTEAPVKAEKASSYVPDVPVNVDESIPLEAFESRWTGSLNGVSGDYVDSFELGVSKGDSVKYRRNGHKNLINEVDFLFCGECYGGTGDEVYFEYAKDGEVLDTDGTVYKNDELRKCDVVGFSLNDKVNYGSSSWFFYGDINLNSDREDVEAVLGTGYVSPNWGTPVVMYNNGKATLVVVYETKELSISFDGESTKDAVKEIYLISNNIK